MKVINAKFRRLQDITLNDVYGAIGVYVLWSGNAMVRPTYIGEGSILKRFADHSESFYWPITGVVAIMDSKKPKRDAEIIEALLLHIAYEIDRFPTKNKKSGKWKRINKIFRRHGVLRINITGYDPLLLPTRVPLKKKKLIELRVDSIGETKVKHSWHSRPHF